MNIRSLFVLWLVLFCPLQVSAQQKKELKNFLKLFPKTTLPVCYQYDDSALVWDEEYGIVVGVKKKNKSISIPEPFVNKFLLRRNESSYTLYETDTMKFEFYPIHLISKNRNFYALTFEQQEIASLYSWAEKYLVTIDKKGNLISKLEVASCGYRGTSIYKDKDDIEGLNKREEIDSFIRVPWYPRDSSCIHSISSINIKWVDDEKSFSSHYQIDKKGNITKIK